MDKYQGMARRVYESFHWASADPYGDFINLIGDVIRAAVAEAVAAEREACCCDICFWCRDMRDEEYSDVVHEGGGAWIHEVDDEVWRCEAETIRARAAASADDTL